MGELAGAGPRRHGHVRPHSGLPSAPDAPPRSRLELLDPVRIARIAPVGPNWRGEKAPAPRRRHEKGFGHDELIGRDETHRREPGGHGDSEERRGARVGRRRAREGDAVLRGLPVRQRCMEQVQLQRGATAAPDSAAARKHSALECCAGVEPFCDARRSVACPRPCNAAACWPTARASASQKANAKRRRRFMNAGPGSGSASLHPRAPSTAR